MQFPRASTLELKQAADARYDREARINRAWEAYRNELPDTLAKTEGDPEAKDNVRLPLARLIVDKGVSFLFGFNLDFEVDGQKESEAEKWLEACLDANHRMTTFHKLGVNGGVGGHAFIRVLPANEAKYGHPYPRLVVWDPGQVNVEWEPDDVELARSFTYEWKTVREERGRQVSVACRQVIARDGARWTITDEESVGDSPIWVQLNQDVWPLPWAPVFHCQNLPCPNEFYGLSDLEPAVVDLNRSVNFTASNINRILRVHGHPILWGRGFAGNIDTTPGKLIKLPGENSTLATVEMQSDLTSSLTFFREERAAFFMVTRIPEVSAGTVDDLGQLSGVALQILYGPAVELTETKRLTYGELLSDLCSRLLELGGKGKGHVVKPQWPRVLPLNPKEDAETAGLLDTLGVSKDTLLSKLGFDPKAEAKKKAQEQQSDKETGRRLLDRENRGGDTTGEEDEPDEEEEGDA